MGRLYLTIKFVLKFIFLFIFTISFHQAAFAEALTAQPDLVFLKKKLKQKKFSPAFTKAILKNYDAESFSPTLKLNMLGFLNPPQHSVLVTDEGVFKSEEFIQKNKKIFTRVEKRDHVAPSVIASLLWVETKHGKLTGRYHVTSVFLHLIQVTRTDVIKNLTSIAIETEKEKTKPMKGLKKLMLQRSKRKAEWAFDQLKALEKLYKKDKKMVQDLEGSFAGAFGIPQFIPTSYFTYARPLVASHVADLYTAEDAISSVSNYLRKTGWNSKKQAKKMKALMHYNNSQDYAESILELSKRIISSRVANQTSK